MKNVLNLEQKISEFSWLWKRTYNSITNANTMSAQTIITCKKTVQSCKSKNLKTLHVIYLYDLTPREGKLSKLIFGWNKSLGLLVHVLHFRGIINLFSWPLTTAQTIYFVSLMTFIPPSFLWAYTNKTPDHVSRSIYIKHYYFGCQGDWLSVLNKQVFTLELFLMIQILKRFKIIR